MEWMMSSASRGSAENGWVPFQKTADASDGARRQAAEARRNAARPVRRGRFRA